jgi:hypothetical protein
VKSQDDDVELFAATTVLNKMLAGPSRRSMIGESLDKINEANAAVARPCAEKPRSSRAHSQERHGGRVALGA